MEGDNDNEMFEEGIIVMKRPDTITKKNQRAVLMRS